MSNIERIEILARELGFDWFGVAPAEALQEELTHFRQWLAEGRHGEMRWLEKEPERRADPARVLEECRTVIIVGMNYLREEIASPAEAVAPPQKGLGRISKYARTRDYHRVIEKRLRKLSRAIEEEIPGALARSYVDYGPIFERQWAVRAGLGFVGKHTLLINPREGSFHFLGAVLTTAVVESVRPAPVAATCGDCRRCIDACPTQAITEPYRLDATRCLSYLTIEKQGPVPEEFWPGYAGWLFGCDICQDVCPYNQSRAISVKESPLGPELAEGTLSLARLIEAPEQFIGELGDQATPFRRAGAESLRRNAMIVASEQGDLLTLEALQELLRKQDLPEWMRTLGGEVERRLARKLE